MLDTTVLVYAMGDDHPLQPPCRAVIELASLGQLQATTTPEVIQEFAHVRARRRSRRDAGRLARDFARGLGLPETAPGDLEDGLALFEDSTLLGAFDAVLATIARNRGWGLVSADQAFRSVKGLTHPDPASPGFLGALGAAE